MAAAIEIVHGPGKGWKYVLAAEEVRVGRGAGHQVRLDDPAWGGGHLRVQYRQGGYVVTNRMGHPVLLDTRPLGDGEQATWFTGVCLQPTGGTLLRLAPADRPADVDADAGVIPIPPGAGGGAKRKKLVEWIALGVILLIAGGLAAKDQFKPAPPLPADRLETNLRPALRKDLTEADADRVLGAIRKGMVCRSQGDPSAARWKYLEAKRVIVQVGGGKPVSELPASLADAHAFVADQIADLDRRQ